MKTIHRSCFPLFLVFLVCIFPLWGQTFSLLHSFEGNLSQDGRNPLGSLVQGGSSLYGMTVYGGIYDAGIIYRIQPDGSGYTKLHDFQTGSSTNGGVPNGSLHYDNGVLYGLTQLGGTNNEGTVFRMNANGSNFQVLHSMSAAGTDGNSPRGSLARVGNTLFGMTYYSGFNGDGTIFSIGTDGSNHTQLYEFNNDGDNINGSLVESGGTLYGMSPRAGVHYRGTAFSIKPDGSDFTVIHDFSSAATDGSYPYGSLISDGVKLYGMTAGRQSHNDSGTIFRMNPDGSDFELLHTFDPAAEGTAGSNPRGDLLLEDGVLYGMTRRGGATNDGVVFQINTDGTGFSVLHEFEEVGTNGAMPRGSLVLVDQTLYGMTEWGGENARGTIFAIAIPEPGTWVLSGILLLTALGLGYQRRG